MRLYGDCVDSNPMAESIDIGDRNIMRYSSENLVGQKDTLRISSYFDESMNSVEV